MASITLDLTPFTDPETGRLDEPGIVHDWTRGLDLTFDAPGPEGEVAVELEFTGPVEHLYRLIDLYAESDGDADALCARIRP